MKNKKRRKWGRWLIILLIILLLACIPRIRLPSERADEKPVPTATSAAYETQPSRSVVMKSREQLAREYGLTTPPLPTMRPSSLAGPITTATPETITQPVGKSFSDLIMSTFVLMLTMMTGTLYPIPLY